MPTPATLEEMSDHDLQHVESLFQAAADLPADERDGFLDERCADDETLRREVERLLTRFDQDASLTSPVLELVGRPGAGALTEGPGTVIGRYKLLQTIGEGGFGVVYMAEQQRPVVRKVALKIIKLGMDTREVVARFEAERQALAMMDHPNIARVLDGGATESGRPYFVMELVRGVAITEYCDKDKLSTRERLELFEEVCHALQHAHQKGVIHRDLKPTNVMVTLHDSRPVPKVIDFGVAKAMHARLTDKTLFTRYEQFIGTPAYMSPEQAEMSGLDVDTRTDIYSLGVLLYELMTGSTPFDTDTLRRAGLAGIQRIIREEHPARPSLRISTTGDAIAARHRGLDVDALSRRLRGDLDWIVMKAMEKDRSRRYPSASALAEDIGRHLRHEPVVAGPPSAMYRTRKFLSRNRAAVVSAAIVVLTLVGGIIGTTMGMIAAGRSAKEAQDSATRASEQSAHALAALDFLDSTLALTDPEVALDPDVTVREMLEYAADTVSDAFAEQPWGEVRVRSTIGRAYAAMGEDALAEVHLRRAVELVDRLTGAQGPDVTTGASIGYGMGDFYDTLWALTNVCFNQARDDSFAVSTRAREVGLRHIGAAHPEVEEILRRFLKVVEAGAWSVESGAMIPALPLLKEAGTLVKAELPPGDSRWPIVADTFLTAGYMVWYTPHEPVGVAFCSAALEIQGWALPPEHPDIATTEMLIVGMMRNQGFLDECEKLARSSVERLRGAFREDHIRVATAESVLGDALVRNGKLEEAEPLLVRSHRVILDHVNDETNWMASESFVRLIGLYDAMDTPAQARPYRDALARATADSNFVTQWPVTRAIFGPEHARLRDLLDQLDERCGGIAYLGPPGTVEAPDVEPLLREIIEVRSETLSGEDDRPRSITYARLLLGWANALSRTQHAGARRLMAEEARTIFSESPADLPLEMADALTMIASDRPDSERSIALGEARQAWVVLRDRGTSGMWFGSVVEVRVGRTLFKLGLYEEAETLLRSGYEALAAQLGERHEATLVTRGLLVDLYEQWGKPEMAVELGKGP